MEDNATYFMFTASDSTSCLQRALGSIEHNDDDMDAKMNIVYVNECVCMNT